MADSDINGLTQATDGYVDATDELIIQKSGETTVKKVQVNDLFGGWRDLIMPFTSSGVPPTSAPTLTTFVSGSVQQYVFAVNDYVAMTFHIDHDMKQGATMYPHMHWSTDGTSTASVKWEVQYTVAARNDVTEAAFPAPTTLNLEASPNGTAWSHYVTEDATGVATPTVDSLICVTVKRVTNGGVDNTDAVFGLTLDWHYPTQMYATKSRAPDFYT